MERQNFEDSWKKAFEKAEVAPSENVWTNIELGLERANGSRLKRRLVVFQLVAAASVIFALGLGAGIFIMKNSYEESARLLAANVAAQNNSQAQLPTTQVAPGQAELNAQRSSSQTAKSNPTPSQPTLHDKTSTLTLNQTKTSSEFTGIASLEETNNEVRGNDTEVQVDDTREQTSAVEGVFAPYRDGSASKMNNAYLPQLVQANEVKLMIADEKPVEADPVQLMLARLDQREKEVRAEDSKNKANRGEKLWTSVGVSAGSFNAVNSGVSNKQSSTSDFYAANSAIANPEAKASGTTYSIGANIGTKLTNRWVFQGGVNYLTQSSDYTAHSAIKQDESTMSFRPASINELDKLSTSDVPAEEKLVSTAPYNVNNNIRYLSIPMQAGYVIINKNFGLQLNAGVATDLFLQNTVSAEGGNLDNTTQGIGEDSPYRSVNLSGLAGTELSYRFSKNYRIALNPGLRYPFNSVYKSEIAVKSTPITFDIGLRFRYIFH